MKLGLENRKQVIQSAILVPMAIGAIIYLASQFTPSNPKSVPISTTTMPSPAIKPAVKAVEHANNRKLFAGIELVNSKGSRLDPTLHPEIMMAAEHLEYTGTGRNIFSASSAAVIINIPKPIAPARIINTVQAPTGPPPPPPIPLKLFGVETRTDGSRQVFLSHDEDIFMAQVGDIVMRTYKVTRITTNSVEMVDLVHNDKQVLALAN